MDAATEFGMTWLGLMRGDSERMLDGGVSSSKRSPLRLVASETGRDRKRQAARDHARRAVTLARR